MTETMGALIRRLRIKKGLTQAELAKEIGVSQSIIGQYELDKRNPKRETINALANALGCEIGSLLAVKFDSSNETPEISYYDSQEFLDTSRQFFRILNAQEFLKSLQFSFVEKIIFDDIGYSRSCTGNNSRFVSDCISEKPIEYTEAELIDIIKNSSTIPKHIVEISYGNSNRQMDYYDYLKWMNNFIESARLTALQQYHNAAPTQIFLDEISKVIEHQEA